MIAIPTEAELAERTPGELFELWQALGDELAVLRDEPLTPPHLAPTTREDFLRAIRGLSDALRLALGEGLDVPDLEAAYDEPAARAAADRLLHALAGVRAQRAVGREELVALIRHYEGQAQANDRKLEAREAWLLNILERLFGYMPLRGKAKSIALLAGRLGRHRRGGRWKVVDAEALVSWALQKEPALVETEIINKVPQKAIAGFLESDQHLGTRDLPGVPGVVWDPEREDFYAEPESAPRAEES